MLNKIREKYSIPGDSKVILYVGNISHNKNQEQIARAFALLPEGIRRQTYLLFCGGGVDEGLNVAIANCKEKEHLVICGLVDKFFMPDYYKAADGVALLSFAEGFGLSLVEGMHFGLPCLMFSDMDAFEDIYDDEAVVAVNDRTDEAVAKGLEQLLSNCWDSDKIKNLSCRFESWSMARKYIRIYKNILG